MTTTTQTNRSSNLILKNQGGKINASKSERIALVCSMNRRHKAALEKKNKSVLLKLAKEYSALGCPRTASMIRIEARAMVKGKVP